MKVESTIENQEKQKEFIEFDIDALIKLGTLEREIELGDVKITLRTLTEEERQLVEAEVNDGLPFDDPKHILNAKIPTLSYAIVKINGKPILPQNRANLVKILQKMQSYVLDMLYMKYMELVRDQLELLNLGVKKNGL